MVTCRELVDELSRICVACISYLYALLLVAYLVARLAVGDRFWMLAAVNNFAFYCFLPLLFLIPFGLATRAKRGLLATLPLAVLGIVWFAPYFMPKSSPPAGATLRIVSFNVYRSNHRPQDAETWLHDTRADLVFLQEVPYTSMYHFVYDLGGQYPHIAVTRDSGSGWGNMFLSRYPILEKENLEQPFSTPYLQQRYVLDVNGQQVAVYNVDMLPPEGQMRFTLPLLPGLVNQFFAGYDDTWRNMQLEGFMAQLRAETLPFIVAGDFNTGDQTITYEKQLAPYMRDSFREAGRGIGATWPVGEVEGVLPRFVPPLLRMDYIWHSSHFQAVSAGVGPKLGSDHLPVSAELGILPG